MPKGRGGEGENEAEKRKRQRGFVISLETTVGTRNAPLGSSGKPCRTHALELPQLWREGPGN